MSSENRKPMKKYPTIWGGGQLLAFSGMDGTTDYKNGLCLRTVFHGYAFELKTNSDERKAPMIRYTGPEPESIELTINTILINPPQKLFRFVGAEEFPPMEFVPPSNHGYMVILAQ